MPQAVTFVALKIPKMSAYVIFLCIQPHIVSPRRKIAILFPKQEFKMSLIF